MRRTWRNVLGVVVIAALVTGMPGVVCAASKDDVTALKKQVAEMNAKIATLEQQLAAKTVAAPVPVAAPAQPEYDMTDPFVEMAAMHRHLSRMMADPFGGSYGQSMFRSPLFRQPFSFNPDYDIKETDSSYVMTFDMPGMDKSKINVEIKDGALIVSGERSSEESVNQPNYVYRQQRSFGYFSRVIPLPSDAKADSIEARYDNGVLTITVGKKEPEKQKADNKKKIDVK